MSKRKNPAPIKCEVKIPATIPLFILGGMSVILIFAWINGIIMQMIGYEYTASTLGTSDPEAIYLYITVALAPAFCEEFLFRGVIYGNLRRYGMWSATLISALLFALMHQSISQTLYTFAAGIVMALTYELTGSIWCSTFLHMFNNLYSVVQEVIAARLGPECYKYLNMADGVIIILGLYSMIVLCILAIHRLKKMRKAVEEKAQAEEANLTMAQDSCERMTFGQVPRLLTPAPESGQTPDKITAKGFFAPGIIVFLVMAFITTVIDAAWGLGLFTGI
ncbi:MAG: lysostaphin resistance A-like protein, partial [Eubacteriales bacterium]